MNNLYLLTEHGNRSSVSTMTIRRMSVIFNNKGSTVHGPNVANRFGTEKPRINIAFNLCALNLPEKAAEPRNTARLTQTLDSFTDPFKRIVSENPAARPIFQRERRRGRRFTTKQHSLENSE